MSIQTQIDRISGNVSAALSAIVEKGVTVPDGSTSDALAGLIASIEAGGANNIVAGRFILSESLTTASPLYIDITFPKNEFPLMYCAYEETSNLTSSDTSHTAVRMRYIIASKLRSYGNNTEYYAASFYNKANTTTMGYIGDTVTHVTTGYSAAGGVYGSMDISLKDNQIRFKATSNGQPYLGGRTYNYILYWGD